MSKLVQAPADYWSLGRATQDQQIAADRLASKAARLRSITQTAMTKTAREQAKALRREIRALCVELGRSGL